MATIEIPKVRKESTVIMYVSLTDNGVTVDWTSLSEIKPFMYSDEQHCIAGKCTAEIATGAPETLIVRYPTTAPQFLGQNSLLIRCTYDGNEKSFDVPVLEFVDRSSEATGVTVIEDPELPVAIEVQDVDTSVLDDAIAAALDAAAKATAAAELVPLDILAQCQAAAEAAEAAAENCAPVIGDNGNWWIYDYDAGEYVDSGKPSRGIQGEQGIQGIQGIQGNTGSSVDYPYELVNNRTTDDATKGLSAAEGKRLGDDLSQLDQKVDKNYGIIVGKVAKDFNVTPGVSYSSQDMQVRMFIPANQPFNFTVHDKTCVSSGKYGLNLYYSDGTSSNPVNPDLNSTVTRTAAKDVVAVGPYISSGKITTAGVLELILENPATMGADVAENTNGIAELDKRTNAIESESGSMTRRFSVKPSVTYDFLDLYLPIHIEKGMQFTFLLQDITSTSSGAFALRQFYADGTNASTSTNPTFNTQFTGTAAKEIVALGAYVSTGKITVAGILEAQAYNGEFAGSRVFTVGTNGDFQTFTAMLRGLRNILGNKTVYVEAGEYDIFDEIGGAEYVASIDTSQTDWNDVADAVPANTTIIGKGTVILKWMPNASDIGSDAKANLFSPLTLTKGNCRIENIEIQCQNCRYGLHDETGQNVKGSVHEFINVKVTHYADTYGLKYAYGGGHSANSKRVFRNCEFVAYYGNVFAEHDWLVSADEGSEFVFENCLIYDPRDATHTPLYFTSSAQNGKIDKVFLSNCYVPNKIHFASGSASGEYNQSYEVTMIGCNAVTATRSENIVNEIEIRQYLSHE